ncbi:MAG: YggT family protein [Chloroflexi bacterium]|nr:YggT family protein [Chloroflexota bacterium]
MAQFVFYLTTVLYVAIIVRAILSWLPLSQNNPISTVVFQITEPVLAPLRRIIPRVGAFDFSPVVALILLFAIQQLVRSLL